MTDAPDVLRTARKAEAVLARHQRAGTCACICGWNELGRSHPGHQATMLARAGLLATQNDTEVS